MNGKYWKWRIAGAKELTFRDESYIRGYDPIVFHNDLTGGQYWAYDTKLPSGKWLVDISLDPVSKTARGEVISI